MKTKKPADPVERYAEEEQTVEAAPNSDAVLNCPSCMTTLCLDCQQHEEYLNQFRAMFVLNCVINRGEVLHFRDKQDKRGRRRKAAVPEPQVEGGAYNPVHCAQCNTMVAVYDEEEVYHFFNIIPGEG
eukprot:m.35010 g.35010  ORF g.35010 m.35010 type:complete len:128 (-) comp13162_c0_seq2:129-512(-)